MFKLKPILWTLGCLVGSVFICVVAIASWLRFRGPDALVRVDKSISLAEARRRVEGFPFPASAHDICYAEYGQSQEYEFVLRFEAPPSDCIASIPNIFRWQAKKSHEVSDEGANSKCEYTHLPRTTSLRPVSWFDNAMIEHGVFAGAEGSHRPQVWVDEDKGILYYREID